MTNAKQVFNTRELSEMIYDFSDQGREEHQDIHYHVCQELSIDMSFKELLPEFYSWYYDNSMRHDETPHIVRCLQYTYSDDQLRLFSLSMKWCRCCSRHSHYKTLPFKPVAPLPESKPLCDCACPCRHLYRLFQSTGLA